MVTFNLWNSLQSAMSLKRLKSQQTRASGRLFVGGHRAFFLALGSHRAAVFSAEMFLRLGGLVARGSKNIKAFQEC